MKLLLFLLFPTILFAQNIQQRSEVETSFVLLKNNDNILPFKGLDTCNFFVKNIGIDSDVLKNSILRYDNVTENINNANLIIVNIFKDNVLEISKLYNELKDENYIICSFGILPDNQNFINSARAIIYTTLSDSLTQDYCGQLLFGAFSIDNKLKNDISTTYKVGSGLSLSGGIRFKYTIPAELQLDSFYIFTKIDSIAEFAIKNQATPGLEVFVAVNQKVIINKSYGYQTYDSLISINNNDLYDLASVTKITASAPAMMYLAQNQIIDVDDYFKKYWHKFRFSNKRKLTLIDAMCHQGQLTPWIPFWKSALDTSGQLSDKIFSTDSSAKFSLKVCDSLYISADYKKTVFGQIKKSALLDKKQYKYSDLSFYIYPQIVEKYTKMDFEEFLDDNFYKKLGANSICYNPLRFYSKNQIAPTEYDKYFRKHLIHGYVHDEGAALLGGVSGHAGLFANANDLAKLAQMYLNYGTYGGDNYIDSTLLKKWTSYQFADLGNRRGIIFDKPLLHNPEWGTPCTSVSKSSFGHSGFTGTFVWADPETGILFVFLSNRVYPTRDNKKLLHYNIRTNMQQVIYDAVDTLK